MNPTRTKAKTALSRSATTTAHRRWVLLIILLLLLAAVFTFDAPSAWMSSLAHRCLKDHQPHAALAWVDRWLRYSPANPAAFLTAARANLQLNLNSEALNFISRSEQAGNDDAVELEAYRLMVAAQVGDVAAAQQLLDWPHEFALPAEAFEAVARCAIYHGDFDLARLVLDQMAQTGLHDQVVAYQRARILEVEENFEEAASAYAAAHAAYPSDVRAAFRAGICFNQLRRFAEAADMFRAAKLPPYESIASLQLANSLWESNELQEAANAIESVLEQPPIGLQRLYVEVDEYSADDEAALVGARIQDALGKPERAVDLLERVLEFNHRSFEARELLIKNLRVLGRLDEAEKVAEVQQRMVANRERCRDLLFELNDNPRDLEKRCELAELYWYTESEAEARLALQDIFDIDPSFAPARRLQEKFDSRQP